MATEGEKTVGYSLVNVGTLTLEDTDKSPYYISIVVCQDKIVVLDWKTSKVKIHRLQDGKCLAMSDRPESLPRDMCLMDAITICVLHGDGLIKMMSIDSTDMSPVFSTTRRLRLQGVLDYYHGVVRFNNNLFVTGRKQGMMCWCIVSPEDGHVDGIHQICKGDGWCRVTTKDNIIYISCDAGYGSPDDTGVYGFDILNPSQCKYTYKHQRLQNPTSIVINEDGNIFVCNFGLPDYCIHQLTASCQLVAIFTQGIPWSALFWDNGRLYGTCYESHDITVFQPVYQGNHKASEVLVSNERKQPVIEETAIQIGQVDVLVDQGQSSVATEMPPSGPVPEDSGDDKQGPVIPVEILRMDDKSLMLYKEALRDGKEKVYNIRVMVVGQYGVGKTTLTKHLLGQKVDISVRKSTEGIDIHKHCCKIPMDTGEWIVQNEDSDQLTRLQRIVKLLTNKTERSEVGDEQEEHGEIIYQNDFSDSDEDDITSSTNVIYHNHFSDIEDDDMPTSPESDIHQNVDVSSQAPVSHDAILESGKPESSIGDATMEFLQLVNEKADELKKSLVEYAALAIWDFAGQYVFYTTHQTFLTCRAIYLLVTNLSQQFTDLVRDDECYFDTEGLKLHQVQDLVEVWLNSIHCCAPSQADGSQVTSQAAGISVTSTATGITMTSTAAGIMVTSPATGITVTSPATAITFTSPAADITVTSPTTGGTVTSPAIGITVTSPATGITLTSPAACSTLTSATAAITGASPAMGITATSSSVHTTVTSPGARTSLTIPNVGIPSAPPVILVGTHVDKIQEDNRQEVIRKYFPQICQMLNDKPALRHVATFFAIDNTKHDPQLKALKDRIFQLAKEQPYWGEEVPTSWLPMEEALMKLKSAGKKVIPLSLVEELNQAASVPIKTKEQLDLFLRFQHEIGTILYFRCGQWTLLIVGLCIHVTCLTLLCLVHSKELDISPSYQVVEGLKEKIVLDPQWFIDALKSLITAEMFILDKYPAIRNKWFELKTKGKLTQELIDAIWTRENNPEFYENKEHVLLVMEKLNIIAKPRIYIEGSEQLKVENYFLAPCMLRQKTPVEVICPEPNDQMESSPVLCYVFIGHFMPSPIFHRLLGACVAHWPIATKEKEETQENQIFCGCCVFQLDQYHKLTIHFREHVIYVRVTRMGIREKTPSSKLCIEVREFITTNLQKIIGYLGQSLKFEYFIQCPEYNGENIKALIPVSLLKENAEVCCNFHNNIIESCRLLNFWFQDQDQSGDGDTSRVNKTRRKAKQQTSEKLSSTKRKRKRISTLKGPMAKKIANTSQSDVPYVLEITGVKNSQKTGVSCSDPELLCQVLKKSTQVASSSRRILEENCQRAGLKFHGETPSNGNCFFEAVSSQLQQLNCAVQKSPQQLRQDVVAFMKANTILQVSEGTINLAEFISHGNFNDYCEQMARDGEWADHIVVVGMARMLQMDIIIVTSAPSSGPDNNIAWVVGQTNFNGQPILLGHIWECHYQSLQPMGRLGNTSTGSVMADKSIKAKAKHNQLCVKLDGLITRDSIKSIKRMARTYLDPKPLENVESMDDLFSALENKGIISVGNYDVLMEIMTCAGVGIGMDEIQKTASDIKDIMKNSIPSPK